MATNVEKIQKAKEKLLAKQAAELAKLDDQIKRAEMVGKNKNRVERLVLKLAGKHPELFSMDPAVLEKGLDEAFAALANQ